MKILSMKYLKYNSLKIISIIVSFSLVMTSVHPLCAKGLFLAVPGSSELLSYGFKEELVVEELSFKKVTLVLNQLIAITENNIQLTLSKKPGNKWVLGIITEEKEVEQIQKIKTTILEKLLRHENREIRRFVMQAKQGMLERRFLSILEELAEEKEPERIVSLTGEILTILVDNRNIKPTKDQFNILIEILVSHKEPYDRYGIAKELTNAIGMIVANNRILFNDLFEKIISLPDNSPELECFLMAELYSLIFIEGTSRHPGKQRLQINVDKFSKLITKFSYQKESGILSWFSRIIIRILEHNPSLNFSQEQFNILLNKFSSETDTMTMEKFPTLLTMATERNPEFFNSFKEQLDKFIAPDKGRTVDVKIEEEYAEELSLFFNLLHNRDELKKLLFFLSILRIIYPDDISNDSALAPLEFAKKNGIIFTYNNFIKVCPVTESFRRHILIIKGKSGKEHLVEIKIPGQAEGRDLIQPTHFTLARKAHNKYKQKNRVAKPVGMASAFGRFRLYNEILGYTRDEYPLRVVIFEYQDGKRLGRHVNRVLKLVNIDYLKRVADNKGITLDELYIDITNQLRFIGKQLLDLGYAGRVRVGRILFNDFHIENFRLLPDGKVIAVGDFGAFERKHLTELQKKRQIGQLIKPWVQGYEAPSRELTKLFRALKNESDTNKANRIGLQVTGMFCNTDLIITKKQIKIILERIRTVPMSGSHYKYDPLNYKLIKELLILIDAGFKGNYNLLKILRDEPDKKFRVFLEKVNDEMGFDLFKKPLPMGSPYKMYEFLRNKRKYVSDKEISDETDLSIKYTIEPDLRTLYFLGLVRKEFREEEIVYQAISINKTEWEEIVEPILADLGSHPGKKEKEDAKNELIKKLNKFRAKQKKNFQKYAADRTKRNFFDEVVVVPLGGVKGIGRSALYVKAGYTRFLIDAGQGIGKNQPFMPRFDLADEGVDFILVSHPHIDHIGCLPEAIDLFGDIPIYATAPVREKIEVQLKNKASIASRVLNYKDRGIELLADSSRRSIEDIGDIVNDRIRRTMRNIRTLKMDQFRKMSKEVKISFQNAGHLLEANTITICTPYENIFYTGDFSWVEGRTIKRIQYPKDITIDRLIIESTYGGRLHRGTRKQREEELIKIIKKVYKRNGTVLIPAFALGRTSEIALMLAHYKRIGKLPKSLPVYIDGLSERMMRIDLKYAHLLPESTRKDLDYLLNKDESLIKSVGSNDMRDRIVNEPCCIIVSSGMLLENSLSARYYAPRILSDPHNALIFVGYQAEGTPGRRLLQCDKGEIFVLGKNEIPVNASINLISFSSHADHDEIIQFIEGIRPQPQQVMIVHGEELAKAAISSDLQYSKIFNGDIVIPTEEDETSLFTISEEMKEERTQEFNAIRTQRKVELRAIFKRPPKDRRRRFIKEIPAIFGINYEDLTKGQRTRLIRMVRENEKEDKSIGRMRIDLHQMRIDEGKESFWELVGGKHLKGSKKGIMRVPFMVGIALFGLTLLAAVVFWHQIITFILNVRNYLASIDGVNLSLQELFGRLRLALNFTVVGSMNFDWHNGRGRLNSVNHRRSKDAQDRPSENLALLTSMRAPDIIHNTIIDIHKELGIEKTIRLVMEWAYHHKTSNITIRKEINKLQAISKGVEGEEIKRIQVAILGILMIKFLDTFVEKVLSGTLDKEFSRHTFLVFIENIKIGIKPTGKIKVSDNIIWEALHTIVQARPSRGIRPDEAIFWYLPLHYIKVKRKGLITGSILKPGTDILKSQ